MSEIDFSIDPLCFYIHDKKGKYLYHTEDFNRVLRMALTPDTNRVYLWSDPLLEFVNCTKEIDQLLKKLGY